MSNIAIYLWDQPYPIVIAGEGKAPAELILCASQSGQIEGLAIKAEGAHLERPHPVSVPFDRIRRLALSSAERPGHLDSEPNV